MDDQPPVPYWKGHAELPDQPELYGVQDRSVADAWSSLLSRYHAHAFVTLTFRMQRFYRDKAGNVRVIDRTGHNGSVHPELADKAFRVFVSKINGAIYGRSWSHKWHRGCQWVRGSELHLDGRLHFHALIAAPTDDLWKLTSIRSHHRWWLEEFGFNRIERPRSQRDVRDYVADYVVKDGLLDFSKNFGAWLPPCLDFTHVPIQAQACLDPAEGDGTPAIA